MDDLSSNLTEIYSGKDFKWCLLDRDVPVAVLGLSQVNKMMKTAEIGYQVNAKYRKEGIGKKAAAALIRKVFKESDIRKLIAIISDTNIPSCKIVESLGFQQEGLLRKHFLINGKAIDERIYGLLKNEFLDY
jgi:ribosomal-protein-alanine N-acetyltransferase